MTWFDRYLQNRRIDLAASRIGDCEGGCRVLDVGAFDGTMFDRMGDDLAYGFGIEPTVEKKLVGTRWEIWPGFFPDAVPSDVPAFDAITMLAVLEHLPEPLLSVIDETCARLLGPKGRVVLTVPAPAVDRIIDVLVFLRLIDGMAHEEHHGFDVRRTEEIFCGNGLFRMIEHRKFQLGLNNLYVFEKVGHE